MFNISSNYQGIERWGSWRQAVRHCHLGDWRIPHSQSILHSYQYSCGCAGITHPRTHPGAHPLVHPTPALRQLTLPRSSPTLPMQSFSASAHSAHPFSAATLPSQPLAVSSRGWGGSSRGRRGSSRGRRGSSEVGVRDGSRKAEGQAGREVVDYLQKRLVVWLAINYNRASWLAMHRKTDYYEDVRKDSQKDRHKLSQGSKLVVSAVVALLWLAVTHGEPRRVRDLEGVDHVETTVEYIFETTIAVQKKRFMKRIIEESSGLWQYIPYANQPKWVDLEIQLTTRIGFDVRSEKVRAGVSEGRLQVEVYEPTVLDKQWRTKIVDKSDFFFAKWDIKEFEDRSQRLLEDLAAAESELLLDSFKSDSKKMAELAQRLDQRLASRNSVSPLQWVDRVNRFVKGKVEQLTSSVQFSRAAPQILTARPQGSEPSRASRAPRASNSGRGSSRFKQISYSQQEEEMRRQMKNQLNW